MWNGEFLFDSSRRAADSPPALVEIEHVEGCKEAVAGTAEPEARFAVGYVPVLGATLKNPAIGVPVLLAPFLTPPLLGAVASSND
jgi:hypothetical protein